MQHKPSTLLTLTKCTDRAQTDLAVDIITASFAKDQAMVHFVGDALRPDTVRHDIVVAITNAHFRAREPVFLLFRNQQAIGAALVEVTRSPVGEILSVLRSWRLWRRLPKGCIKRLNTYRTLARRGSDGTSNYLTMIGIRPDLQGEGLGRQFMEQLEQVIGPKRSWSLDTENPKNVPFYEKLGYTLINKVDWEGNTIYQMHKSGG